MNYVEQKTENKTELKIPVLTYSRVSGYYNPVTAFNKGKREEFSERQYLNIQEFKKWENLYTLF